jgi:uncharacterized membrane protein YfcA
MTAAAVLFWVLIAAQFAGACAAIIGLGGAVMAITVVVALVWFRRSPPP